MEKKIQMLKGKMAKKPMVIIAILIIIGGGYYWYSKANTKTAAVTDKTAIVEKGTLVSSISASGNVIVDQSATVDPTITGTVANLLVNVGDKVKKGQTLFTIINDDLNVNGLLKNHKLAKSIKYFWCSRILLKSS